MGKYVNVNSKGETLPLVGKVNSLINDGGKIVNNPSWKENLVCVVNNGPFEAAAYAYSESEFNYFKNDNSGRPTTWVEYPHAKSVAK